MTQYIDKAALVAEIDREVKSIFANTKCTIGNNKGM